MTGNGIKLTVFLLLQAFFQHNIVLEKTSTGWNTHGRYHFPIIMFTKCLRELAIHSSPIVNNRIETHIDRWICTI